jgi:hypothetical protein
MVSKKRIDRTLKAFKQLEEAQAEYNEACDNLSEEEEALFEERLMDQGVKITRLNQSEQSLNSISINGKKAIGVNQK